MSGAPAAPWRRVALGGAGGMFVAMGLGRFSYTAMVPAMVQSGQLGEVEAGLVGGGNLVAFLLGAWLSEPLRRAVPIHRLLPGAVWLGVLALLASALPWGALWLGFWRGILGLLTGLIMVQSLTLATGAAPADRRAVAAGAVFAGVGIGIFLSGALIPVLLRHGLAWAWGGVALAGLIGAVVAQWGWTAAGGAAAGEQAIPQGTSVNNVDVRQNVPFGAQILDVVVANLRDAGKLAVFKVNPNYAGSDVLLQIAGKDSSNNDIQIDSYGLSLYKRKTDGALFFFERSKTGTRILRQYRLEIDSTGTRATLTPVRDLNYSGGVAEGMVADDELGYLYVSEENFGVHKYFADPNLSNDVIATFALDDGIVGNREGLALYACGDSSGYLILSSQGNSTYKIYERQGSNRFLKTIMPFDDVGETTLHTDGLDVTSAAVLNFPQGFLVAHDESGSHFLLYDWAQIAEHDLTICVNGIPALPAISAAPTSHDFGEVAIGDSSSTIVVVKNVGTALLTVSDISLIPADEFRIDGVTVPIALTPGDSFLLAVQFVPLTTGSKSAVLHITSDNDGSNLLVVNLSGTAFVIARPQIAVLPAAHDFGDLALNDSASATLVVKNIGDAVLTISEIRLIPGEEFRLDSVATPLTIAPGDSFSLGLRFVPLATGLKNATLRLVSDDADNNLLDISLTGRAFLPSLPIIAASHPAVDYGQVFVDSTASKTLFLYNRGSGDLQVTKIEIAGEHAGEFGLAELVALNQDSASVFAIATDDSLAMIVEFTPRLVGAKNAMLRIISNATNIDSLDVALAGEGVASPVSVADDKESPLLPDRVALKPNYPNPFNAETTIEYSLPASAHVKLVIYNLRGQPIRILIDSMEGVGFKKIRWNGRDQKGNELGSGIYYLHLQVGEQKFVGKVTLLK